ncbi:MAG: 4Fe-4S binding protein [Kofleriaceae bacterium]
MTRRDLFSWLRPAAPPAATATPERSPLSRAAPPPPSLPATMAPVIDPSACLATTTTCSVCVEQCPRPGAIVVTAGRPRIVTEACDGCGRCVARCPAPTMAIGLALRPPGSRP